MSRREQSIGKAGQNIAAVELRRLGVDMLEQIATPVHLIPHRSVKGFFRVVYGEQVSGDFRGVLLGGRSVLVEVKTVDHNLRWSDFSDHQPVGLERHKELGGLSLVVWVHSFSVYVMRWPIAGFAPGKGLTVEQAREADTETREFIALPF